MFELTSRRLRWLNLTAAFFQALSGCAILGISSYDGPSSLPWFTFFIGSWSRDTAEEAAQFYRRAGIWSGTFLLLSALDHLLVALPRVSTHYVGQLCRNRNPYRWAEYAVSASIMQVMIAQLCGITDVHLLFAVAALMASCMLFGWQMEVLNGDRLACFEYPADPRTPPTLKPSADAGLPFISDSPKPLAGADASHAGARVDWTPFLMGCWPFLASMAITACFFFQGVSNGSPPGFVWAIWFILFALYLLFAVNQWLQFKQVACWRGFARAEFFYIILSFTSKQLLAWITYGGTKRFED